MKISRETVEYVAELARLYVSEEEKRKLVKQMGEIIGYVEKINKLDTSGVEPLEHVENTTNVFREDKVKNSLKRELILENAPEDEDGAFRVPEIME